MSAPYPTGDKAAYPADAPPSYNVSVNPASQQAPQPVYNQQQAPQPVYNQQQAPQPVYNQQQAAPPPCIIVQQPAASQPVQQTVVVGGPAARVYVHNQSGFAVGAMVVSVGACLCTCWPIGLIAFILASKHT